MENRNCEASRVDELVDLGMVLGENQAFGFLAGRCSAAQAESIRRLRNEKMYKCVTEHWKEFCPEYLKMSGTQADTIIRLWEEFGAGYFEVAQLTRVSPGTYRLLEPSIHDGVLNLNGQQIELTVENSRKVAAAVSEIRRTHAPKTPDRIARLDRLCTEIIGEFSAIPRGALEPTNILKSAIVRLQTAVAQFRSEVGF